MSAWRWGEDHQSLVEDLLEAADVGGQQVAVLVCDPNIRDVLLALSAEAAILATPGALEVVHHAPAREEIRYRSGGSIRLLRWVDPDASQNLPPRSAVGMTFDRIASTAGTLIFDITHAPGVAGISRPTLNRLDRTDH